MQSQDFDVPKLMELTPRARPGGGFDHGYARECICLFAADDVDIAMLRMTFLLEVPKAINAVIPLGNDGSLGWDDAHTMMALIADDRRGIIEIEQGKNNPRSERMDCFYVRFCGFKLADVPLSGSSKMIEDVHKSIRAVWQNTKIMSDLERRS